MNEQGQPTANDKTNPAGSGGTEDTQVGFRTPARAQNLPAPADFKKSEVEGGASKEAPPTLNGVEGASTSSSPTHPFLLPGVEPGEIGRLENYRVLRLLGSGGMGMVFHAEDIVLRRAVALKVMRPELQANDEGWQRMLREARAMAAIKHEHLITVYQAGKERDVFFVAMELLEGESLDQRIKRVPESEVPDILRLGREMASGLAAIHQRGLIHRDIKPSNIWLEAPGARVKILDFGLARQVENSSGTNLTEEGTIVGTPAFMSPEQARGETVDARTDLFSLGCVLYDLCTGTTPFRGKTLMAQLTALAVDTPRPVHEVNPRIPESLSRLIAELLSKNPAARPVSAVAVGEELSRIESGGLDVNTVKRSAPSPGAARAKGNAARDSVARSSPWIPFSIALVFGLLCLGIIAAIWSTFKAPEASAVDTPAVAKLPQASNVTPPTERPPQRAAPPDDGRRPPRPPGDQGPPEQEEDGRPDRPKDDFRRNKMPVIPNPEALSKLKTHTRPADNVARIYAIDLPASEMDSVYFPINSGKAGRPNPMAPPDVFRDFSVQGQSSPHGIGMHSGPDNPARVTLSLGKKYNEFSAVVSQNDGLPPTPAQLYFSVYGDGKLLWKSNALSSQNETQRCVVPVKDVLTLRLEVNCVGEPRAAHAIWFEPYLE